MTNSLSQIYDIHRNVVVSAPAGSGKTEKLARRYIALLSAGVPTERILAITFTEKAAAEMKERVLRILRNENPEIYKKTKKKIFQMRISTIHSFCLSMLKRFAFELELDPNFEIIDPKDSGIVERVLSASFTKIVEEKNSELRGHLSLLSSKYGWTRVKETIERLFLLRPSTLVGRPEFLDVTGFEKSRLDAKIALDSHVYFRENYGPALSSSEPEKVVYEIESVKDLLLTGSGTPRKRFPKGVHLEVSPETYKDSNAKIFLFYKEALKCIINKENQMLYDIFLYCNQDYDKRKKELNVLDFNDLEYLAYGLLNNNPEVDNILFAFDENTDHILVDEFQDTNFLQWSIINKLTEEWRSGMGSKRETGIDPTLFIVGDEKQSIYGFRNANVEVFATAAREMEKWYGKAFLFERVGENYRCGRNIVDFVNGVFSRIMIREHNGPKWRTSYEKFSPTREISGKVELIKVSTGEGENQAEAKAVADKILAIIGKKETYVRGKDGKEIPEGIKKGDIAVLLRKRTHLADFEEAFLKAGIDFVTVNGLGFYQQQEIVALRSLLFTLVEPSDDMSLYLLLKSPLIGLNEDAVLQLVKNDGLTLYDRIDKEKKLLIIKQHVAMLTSRPMSHILESFMEKSSGWEVFYRPQSAANIRKFIEMIQGFESTGYSLQDIRGYFEERVDADEESKANLNTEDTDAVKIMTVHTAKGLEFPVVFFVRMGDELKKSSDTIRIHEKIESTGILYCPDKEIRDTVLEFSELKAKDEEEEKRIFYVAVTRARDYLVLSGVYDEKIKGYWKYLQ